MKQILSILFVLLSMSLFSQDNKQQEPCNDCIEVKQAVKASRSSSSGMQHKRSFSLKRWSRVTGGKMHMRMKKTFSRSQKVKTSFALCFNWH